MAADNNAGTTFFRYRGRSMWPTFQEGDLLEVQPATMEDLRIGDCITYRLDDGGTLVSHRVSAIRGELVLTHGDAMPWPDDISVKASQLVGRVIGRYRLGGLKLVRGGVRGRLAAGFYHYAGRLDPQRDARGGRVSRLLRGSLQCLATGLYRRGKLQGFGDAGKKNNLYWLIGHRPWASLDRVRGVWLVPWPQSLLIDPAKLPCHNLD